MHPRLSPGGSCPQPACAARVPSGARFIRRFTGMEKASTDALSRFVGRYTAACFSLIQGLHELLRPVLGCGQTAAAPAAAAAAAAKR